MYRIYGQPDVRPDNPAFLMSVSGWIPDLTCRISGRIPGTENNRISGPVKKRTIPVLIHEIKKNIFLTLNVAFCFVFKEIKFGKINFLTTGTILCLFHIVRDI
jgi:hypothetical protein